MYVYIVVYMPRGSWRNVDDELEYNDLRVSLAMRYGYAWTNDAMYGLRT